MTKKKKLPRPNHLICVELIVSQINEGMTYIESYRKNSENWNYPESTFSRHWKKAVEIQREQRKKINDKIFRKTVRHEMNRLNESIIKKDEALEILSKLAKGEAWKVGDNIIAPSASERISAIKQMSLMEGWDVPTDKNTTNNFVNFLISSSKTSDNNEPIEIPIDDEHEYLNDCE